MSEFFHHSQVLGSFSTRPASAILAAPGSCPAKLVASSASSTSWQGCGSLVISATSPTTDTAAKTMCAK